jgi:hypothetical protein
MTALKKEMAAVKAAAGSVAGASLAEVDALRAKVASLEASLAANDSSASSAQLLLSKDKEIAHLTGELRLSKEQCASGECRIVKGFPA